MLKLLDTSIGREEAFLYSKTVPRLGDIILKNGLYYRVTDVIFDDDDGNIIVEVSPNTYKNNPSKVFQRVPTETMIEVRRLLNRGEKLKAVKLLYEASGSSLKEAKEFCDNLQN